MQVALFTLTNRLRMVQGFTADSGKLAQAAESIDLKQLNRLRSPREVITDNDTAAYLDSANGGISRLGATLQNALAQEDFQNVKACLDATNDAFQKIARAINGFPGRKNLYWLAGQFPSYTYFSLTISEHCSARQLQHPRPGPRNHRRSAPGRPREQRRSRA